MEKCGCQIVSIFFFLHSKTQTCEVFQEVFLSENIFLHLNDRKKQAYNLVEMEFSSTDSLLKFGDWTSHDFLLTCPQYKAFLTQKKAIKVKHVFDLYHVPSWNRWKHGGARLQCVDYNSFGSQFTNSLNATLRLKVTRLMATNLKILVANTQFSVVLATSWSQFWTLLFPFIHIHSAVNKGQ